MIFSLSSRIIDFIFGYEKSESDFKESKVASGERLFSDRIVSGIGSEYTKKIIDSPAARLIGKITAAFARTSLSAYGGALLSFGMMTLLICFVNGYFSGFADTPLANIIVGSVLSALAIPLLFFDKPLCEITTGVGFLEALLHDTLCIKRPSKQATAADGVHPALLILFGILPALAGIFLPIHWVILPILALIHLVLAIFSPEYSFMVMLLTLPLLPVTSHAGLILVIQVGLTAISFVIKVALGKRMYHFEQYDALLIIFCLFILLSGIFNKGIKSFEAALVMTALTLGYFLANNIIVNRRLADNAVNMIVASSVPTAIYGIISYFTLPYRPEWFDSSFEGQIAARAVSTFANPNVYAVFLITAIVFSLAYALDKRRGHERIGYFFAFALNTAAMVLTWTRGAWLALILSLGAYLIIHFKKMPKLLLIPLALLPLLITFIPQEIITRFLSSFNLADSSIAVRLSTWRSSLLMLKENLFIGVGIGEESFKEEFLKYAEDAVTSPHSHNLFIEIACQAGIFALLVFCFILLVRIRHIATYRPFIGGSSLTSPVTMMGVCIFSLMAFGMTDYIFYNSLMYFLFWVVFGLGSACLRISRTEHDERAAHKKHTSMKSSSTADITISRKRPRR